jgi:hypothetical protein
MSRLAWGVQVHFAIAKQELTSISRYLQKKPPDEAAALSVLASSLQEMCTGLSKLTDLIDDKP